MITVQVDEVELVQDWQTARQAIQALETIDAKYGGVLAKSLANIKQQIRKAMKDKMENELMTSFRSQLGL